MPVQCDVTPLSGNSGRVMFTPPGNEHCLEDFEDFPAGTTIRVPGGNDFRIGDPVVFRNEDTANIDSALSFGTTYYVVAGGAETTGIQISAEAGGTAITLNGDGGVVITGTINEGAIDATQITGGSGYRDGTYTDVALQTSGSGTGARATIVVASGAVSSVTITTEGRGYAVLDTVTATSQQLGNNDPAGTGFSVALSDDEVGNGRENTPNEHIRIAPANFQVVCQVTEWSMDFSRDEIDVTTLPCDCGTGSKWANFKTTIPGPASGSGSMSVLFTPDEFSVANRLVYSTMLKNQMGATIKLYLNYVEDVDSDVECDPDDTASMYIEAPVTLLGFSVNASTSEALTATINFSLRGTPTHMFYTSIV